MRHPPAYTPLAPGPDKPAIVPAPGEEVLTAERCHISEAWNSPHDEALSIAHACVEPGVTTALHALEGVAERYVVIAGRGRVEVGDLPPSDVGPGDVVVIPAGTPQRISNTGSEELRFYCLCTPRFHPDCYRELKLDA